MADPEHLAILQQGVAVWNQWRTEHPEIFPYLSGANLRGADLKRADFSETSLRGANLRRVNLSEANLSKADLTRVNLTGANLREADLQEADLQGATLFGLGTNLFKAKLTNANLTGANLSSASLYGANLSGAKLRGALLSKAGLSGTNLRDADLFGANLSGADLGGADLSRAKLERAILVETKLQKANLSDCVIYGISAWNVQLEGATQSNLVITPSSEASIQVDNLEVAQFVYLLLNNTRIREVIDTISSKAVLILGRFTAERKDVLDAIREELRKRNYLPVLFDFNKPASQTTVETISTLAHMARFVIADLTDAKSVLQELQAIVPLSPSVMVQPLLLASQEEPGMFDFLRKFPWVLETHRYTNQKALLAELEGKVIAPAEARVNEQRFK
jgi:uncharacterized protein YjbI with pentapeptide repeats